MAKRDIVLKKNLIKQSSVLTVVVVFLAALAMVLQNYDEDMQLEQHSKEGEVNGIRAKLMEVQKDRLDSQKQLKLFDIYIQNHNEDFNLNRESANKWMVEQREKHHLVNLSITLPPFADVQSAVFPLKSGTLIKSDVKLSFSALTDNSVFAFIEKLQKELPGIAIMQDIRIDRTADLSSNVLVEISNHHITPLVNAEISFTWFGIRQQDAKGGPNAK